MDSGDDAAKDDLVMDEDSGEDDECADTHIPADEDESEASETEIAAEVLFAEQFLDSFGGEDAVLAGNLKKDVLREMAATGWEDVEEPDTFDYMNTPYEPLDNTRSYPGLRQGYSGPTADALRNADSPLALFFFFLPVVLWQHIEVCSNEYGHEMAPLRVDERYKRYRSKFRLNPHLPKKTKRDIQTELDGVKPIQPHELCRFIGLLIARTIAPNREKLANHWKTTDEGGIPRGVFGSVLRRDRFMEISRNLHFNPNSDPRAVTDRAWKIRKVVEVLQKTFERGYVAPAHLAFDEAMLPSRSSFNKMRVYMKDKPHKWGTKLVMLCSAVTAYCIRFEVYCGKKQHSSDAHKTDMKSGPAAVVRNLLAVFGPDSRMNGMRLVVVDRFYTSVALAIQLLLMGFYCVGTIMTNRLGYCKGAIEKMKSRPATIARGSFKVSRSKLVPNMTAVSWWDARPVHFLCTGGRLEVDRVARQEFADKVEVPCPRVVKDYHAFTGGVDVHDQLRLQRYSIQRAKSLVLGLIDLAIVNGYIVHKAYHKQKSSRPLTHVKYMKKLHLQLSQLQASDMYEGNTFGTHESSQGASIPGSGGRQTTHAVHQLDEWRNTTTQPKRRQRACKVCSLLRVAVKRATTASFFCQECSSTGPMFLCMKPCRQIRGVAMTCWDIWHREWMNGKLVSVDTGRNIRVRRAADTSTGAPSTPGTPVTPLTPLDPASRGKRRRMDN
ncbi:Hypothetical protein PHPALM_13889 [Phytophthora palmivora]|uniref:PiggyBac transposable element-derived protein domain-containing protein n=1 Tax=Phytophthora palmivora TaxID=4796 RepID=A0A2P4XW71_9STRA|nr:Hypothetical protein PHPALM_13889 [Phytophthora palmivora]